ncbi:unnamed protein product [Caenorhabditis sp. 36 PRJEB53466]|nr:unnamed protein product [Caenorhabditis sp. 36 PRJEB53466]
MATSLYKYQSAEKKVTSQNCDIETNKTDELNWTWSCSTETADNCGTCVYSSWVFDWNTIRNQGVNGFRGHIIVSYKYKTWTWVPIRYDVKLRRSGQCIKRLLKLLPFDFYQCDNSFKFEFELVPIRAEPSAIIESILTANFEPSNLNDAILVVEEKKMHVNKTFLSYHSDYFCALFSSKFKEESMEEIPMKDVKYDDFARLLSAVYPNSVLPTIESVPMLLELADRFLMRAVIRLCEPLIIEEDEYYNLNQKIAMADRYNLEMLMKHCFLDLLQSAADVKKLSTASEYSELSDKTKLNILEHLLTLI